MRRGLHVLLVVLSGCTGSLLNDARITHFSTEQLFVLQSIAGRSLPAPEIDASNPACGSTIVADTLVMQPDGRGERRTVFESRAGTGAFNPETCAGTSEELVRFRRSIPFTYVLDGGVAISYDCSDVVAEETAVAGLCVAPPHLTGRATEIGLVIDNAVGRSPLVYVRR